MSSNTMYPTIKPTFLYIKQHSKTGLKYFGKTIKKDPISYLGSGKYWKSHIKYHGTQYVETIWFQLFTNYDELTTFAKEFSILNDIVNSQDWANLVYENGTDGSSIPRSKEIAQKITETNNERYGCDNPYQSKEIMLRVETERFQKTGYKNASQNPKIKLKKKQTCLLNHGVESGFQLLEKRKQTCLETYGVIWPTQSVEVQYKIKTTNLQRYGATNPLAKGTQPYENRNKTVLEKYGVSNVFASEETKAKIKKRLLEAPIITCPHCNKSGKGGNFTRHHFTKCKLFSHEPAPKVI